MAKIDAQQLARHQADFKGFMHFTCWVIALVIITLVGMAIFLL